MLDEYHMNPPFLTEYNRSEWGTYCTAFFFPPLRSSSSLCRDDGVNLLQRWWTAGLRRRWFMTAVAETPAPPLPAHGRSAPCLPRRSPAAGPSIDQPLHCGMLLPRRQQSMEEHVASYPPVTPSWTACGDSFYCTELWVSMVSLSAIVQTTLLACLIDNHHHQYRHHHYTFYYDRSIS